MDEKYSNPWRTLSSRPVYKNAWIRVREDQVIRPDGKQGIYGVVEYQPCVGILPIDANGNVYLVGQYRYTLNLYSWEIPEGGCHLGEAPLTAAKRELLEELGLIAKNYESLGMSHLSNSVSNEEAFMFLATELTQVEAQPEGTEKLERKIVPFDEAVQMVLSGAITDSLSQIAILHYAARKNLANF